MSSKRCVMPPPSLISSAKFTLCVTLGAINVLLLWFCCSLSYNWQAWTWSPLVGFCSFRICWISTLLNLAIITFMINRYCYMTILLARYFSLIRDVIGYESDSDLFATSFSSQKLCIIQLRKSHILVIWCREFKSYRDLWGKSHVSF